jgi:hypothetical protein
MQLRIKAYGGTIMDTIRQMILLGTIFLCLGVMPVSAEQAPYAITISTSQDNVKVGDDVKILIRLTNISEKEVDVALGAEELTYKVYMWDANGHLLKAKPQPTHVAGSVHVGPLYPNQSVQDGFLVANNLYDISSPGQYTIQVKDYIGVAVATSNLLTVTVTQ